ncbi:class I SAM-dependent methyltransferase [Streptomyces sp. S.PB5]|uniref:class I SAM-dependent methyltransferase n=1 Tax=Streptomyces sp. S.PB5 TaxID=3020844 RepID=UPI0025B25473|nr:class I SAM-dependent methyltransferase [Streptomyces sp. S.PB5]MDN3028605.1 class I SAM-dependent methyltransferase [Streptomyces sp. S.PB5]
MSRPVFSRLYPRMSKAMEQAGMAEHRRTLLAGLTGEVVVIGAGDGANFLHYPPTVTRVLAVEPEPRLRRLAEATARQAPVSIEVVAGSAEELAVPGESFDAAVFAFVLCTVPDPDVALGEALRVLRPGGQLRFLEHVRADTPGLVRVQRLLDATVWPVLDGGCHTRPRHSTGHHTGRIRHRTPRPLPLPPDADPCLLPYAGNSVSKLKAAVGGWIEFVVLTEGTGPFAGACASSRADIGEIDTMSCTNAAQAEAAARL